MSKPIDLVWNPTTWWSQIPDDAKKAAFNLMIDVAMATLDKLPVRLRQVNTGQYKEQIELVADEVCKQGKALLEGFIKP